MGMYDRTWRFFKAGMTVEAIKKLYRELAMKLHPDHGGDAEEFKAMVAEFDIALKFVMQEAFNKAGDEKTKDYSVHTFSDILSKIIHFNVRIEIIGYWIYVFDSYAFKDTLSNLGFWFSQSKRAWVYSGGKKIKIYPKFKDIQDVRNYYGSKVMKDREEQTTVE